MDRLPVGWSPDQLAQLHPDFVAVLVPALHDAEAGQLRVRFRSGHRPNAEQQHLHDSFEARLAAYERGELKVKPLPAAPAGGSAHNYEVDGKPASVACDVQILDGTGRPIPSGGDCALETRPLEWQRWAAILDRHAGLRDGGDYVSRKDPVHVEWVRWNYKERALTPNPETPGEPMVAAPAVTLPALEPTPADATRVVRPRRGGGRRGPEVP